MLRRLFMCIASCVLISFTYIHCSKQQIELVCIVPSKTSKIGVSTLNAVQLCVAKFNAQNSRKRMVVNILEDRDNVDTARTIVNTLPISTHCIVSCGTVDTAEIYADICSKRGIPLLLPTTVSDKPIKALQIMSDDCIQARNMCLYAKHAFGEGTVSIVYSVSKGNLKNQIIQAAKAIGLNIKQITQVNDFQPTTDLILAATSLTDSEQLLSKTNATVIGADGFVDLYTERANIFAVLPFTMQTRDMEEFNAAYTRTYNTTAHINAFYVYQTIQLVCNKLSEMDRLNLKALTSKIYSEPKKNELYLAQIINGRYELYHTQFNPVNIGTVDKAALGNLLIDAYGQYFVKTQLIETGAAITNLIDIDLQKRNVTVECAIWFKYDPRFTQATDITMLDMVEHQQSTLMHSQTIGDNRYDLYKIVGTFRLDKLHQVDQAFYDNATNFSVSFRNKTLDSNLLRYIHDGSANYLDNINAAAGLLSDRQWHATAVQTFEYIQRFSTLGSWYNTTDTSHFSTFSTKVDLQKNQFNLLSYPLAKSLLFLLSILVLLWSKAGLIRTCIYISLLVPLQYIVLNNLNTIPIPNGIKFSVRILFDAGFWFMIAFIMSQLTRSYFWNRLTRKRPISNMLYISIDILYYITAGLFVMAFVFQQPIASFMSSITLLGLLLVMAVKINISNIFSGFFVHLDGCMAIGDWIKLDNVEGRVEKTNWRSTYVRTEAGVMICIPNTKLSESVIENYNYPGMDCTLALYAVSSIKESSERIEQVVMQAFKSYKSVQLEILKYDRSLIYYKIGLALEYYDGFQVDELRTRAYQQLWQALRDAGLDIGVPTSQIIYYQPWSSTGSNSD